MSEDEIEVCPIHGCPMEESVWSDPGGTSYNIFCPKCVDEEDEYYEKLHQEMLRKNPSSEHSAEAKT